MGSPAAHAALSPSARHRWGACPGSVRLEAAFPDEQSGAAALDGTRTHALLERCLTYPGFIIEQSVGQTVTDEGGTYTIDAERVERVVRALTYIKQHTHPGSIVKSEKRVHPDGLIGRADMSGTVDVQIISKRCLEIIDYKDGMHPVYPEDNPQLEQYAIGALAEMEQPYPEYVRMTIIQPKLALRGMHFVNSHEVKTADLLETVVPTLIAQAAFTDDPDAPLVPGEDQCRYCRAKATCPALRADVMEKVGVMFGPIEPLGVAEQAAQKDPSKMDLDELRKIQEAAPLLKGLLDGVEKEIHRRLEAGQRVPGFKLVRGRGSRGWSLTDEEMEKKLVSLKIPKAEVYVKKIVSPAQVEKLTWVKDGETKRLSDAQLKRVEAEWVSFSTGKPTVVPEADPREAITVNVEGMFAPITVEAEVVIPPWINSLPPGLMAPLQDLAVQIGLPVPVTPTPLPDWMK